MNNEQDEIKDIAAQLQRLQIQETELLQRLERLSEADSNTLRSPDATRGFTIGDLALTNPRPLQAKKGTIMRIGADTDQITVRAKKGSKTVQSSFNVRHVEQSQTWVRLTRNHPRPTVLPRRSGTTTRGNCSTLSRPTHVLRNSKVERMSQMGIILTALDMDSPIGL